MMLEKRQKLSTHRFPVIAALTAAVLAACLIVGTLLSRHRPLWNDELFTQHRIIERSSYADILSLDFSEGNICPLFYLLQKGTGDLLSFRLPYDWHQEWQLVDARSQTVMRIPSNVLMSLSLALLFMFFARQYSWLAGCYALGLSLSSFMVWAYWAEARPYALWFFLSTVQALIFLSLMTKERMTAGEGYLLTLVHMLLALTVVFAAVQVALVSLLVYFLKDRRMGRFVYLTMLPLAFSVFFYLRSPHFQFWLKDSPMQLLSASFPKERLLVMAVYGIGWLAPGWWSRRTMERGEERDTGRQARAFFFYTFLMVLSGLAILFMFWQGNTQGTAGFQVSNRYLIYLTPVGIIATALFSLDMVRSWKGKKALQLAVVAFLGILLVMRALRVMALVQGLVKSGLGS